VAGDETSLLSCPDHESPAGGLSLRPAEPGVPVIDPGHTSTRMADELSGADFPKVWCMVGEGNIKAE
jgi:hypothetical protein